jgi:uncharacterized membrane protein
MDGKKRKKIPSHEEWWEAHREQFERTDRMYELAKERWAREAAEREAAHEAEAKEDAA